MDKFELFLKANKAWDNGNLEQAFNTFLRLAESGDAASQLNLGYFFDRGFHARRDKTKAIYWYYKAYRQGDASGANNIAGIHREERHYKKMLWWYRKAVKLGNQEAGLEIGNCYERGLGCSKNLEKADYHYRRVLESANISEVGMKMAKKALGRLHRQLSKRSWLTP